MKKIAIIGSNEFQKKLICKAKQLEFETHVFAWEEGAVGKDVADYFYPISIVEKEKILDVIKNIAIDGICSIASDLVMPTVNYISNNLNLIGNTISCTQLTTDKQKMREALIKNKLPSPKYKAVKNMEEFEIGDLTFPIIVKPKDRSGSRGITKVDSYIDLPYAVNLAKAVSFSEEILVEEFVDGKEYSIEFISQNGVHQFLQITEKFTTGAPHFIEKAHLSPARLPLNHKNRIIKIVTSALDVLEVKNGASHSEIKISTNGEIKIIEIAARMGGDFIGSDMVEISTGYDFTKNIIYVSINETIDPVESLEDNIALVKFVFDDDDINKFEVINKLYPQTIVEYKINTIMLQVEDSSTRNGHFIMRIPNDKILDEIIDILKLESVEK